jgi:flavodoxin
MKTIIYYFTGTGNMLAAAKKIATVLADCELVPIASLQNIQEESFPERIRSGYSDGHEWHGLPESL